MTTRAQVLERAEALGFPTAVIGGEVLEGAAGWRNRLPSLPGFLQDAEAALAMAEEAQRARRAAALPEHEPLPDDHPAVKAAEDMERRAMEEDIREAEALHRKMEGPATRGQLDRALSLLEVIANRLAR